MLSEKKIGAIWKRAIKPEKRSSPILMKFARHIEAEVKRNLARKAWRRNYISDKRAYQRELRKDANQAVKAAKEGR